MALPPMRCCATTRANSPRCSADTIRLTNPCLPHHHRAYVYA
jgi:hypothetical protein